MNISTIITIIIPFGILPGILLHRIGVPLPLDSGRRVTCRCNCRCAFCSGYSTGSTTGLQETQRLSQPMALCLVKRERSSSGPLLHPDWVQFT